jgi:hypothetical protein
MNNMKNKDYDLLLAEKIENILANYMIYKHDNMIIDIIKEVNNFYN